MSSTVSYEIGYGIDLGKYFQSKGFKKDFPNLKNADPGDIDNFFSPLLDQVNCTLLFYGEAGDDSEIRHAIICKSTHKYLDCMDSPFILKAEFSHEPSVRAAILSGIEIIDFKSKAFRPAWIVTKTFF